MIHMIALFPKSIAPEVVEQHVSEIADSLKQSHGLRSLTVSDGHLMSPAGPPAYSKVLESSFESLEDLMGWVQSPAMQSPEAQESKKSLIERGAIVLFYEVNDIE